MFYPSLSRNDLSTLKQGAYPLSIKQMSKESPQQRYNRSNRDIINKALLNQKQAYRSVTVRLHRGDDAELIKWLESQDSIQETIKKALYQFKQLHQKDA